MHNLETYIAQENALWNISAEEEGMCFTNLHDLQRRIQENQTYSTIQKGNRICETRNYIGFTRYFRIHKITKHASCIAFQCGQCRIIVTEIPLLEITRAGNLLYRCGECESVLYRTTPEKTPPAITDRKN